MYINHLKCSIFILYHKTISLILKPNIGNPWDWIKNLKLYFSHWISTGWPAQCHRLYIYYFTKSYYPIVQINQLRVREVVCLAPKAMKMRVNTWLAMSQASLKCFTRKTGINPHNNPNKWILLSLPFNRYENWGTGHMSNFPKVLQLVSGKVRLEAKASVSGVSAFSHHVLPSRNLTLYIAISFRLLKSFITPYSQWM